MVETLTTTATSISSYPTLSRNGIADRNHDHSYDQKRQAEIQKPTSRGGRVLPLASPQSPYVTRDDRDRDEQRPTRHQAPSSEPCCAGPVEIKAANPHQCHQSAQGQIAGRLGVPVFAECVLAKHQVETVGKVGDAPQREQKRPDCIS